MSPDPQIVFAADLLRDLGLSEAPVDEQRAGIAEWLEANEPDPVLTVGLNRLGLLPTGLLPGVLASIAQSRADEAFPDRCLVCGSSNLVEQAREPLGRRSRPSLVCQDCGHGRAK